MIESSNLSRQHFIFSEKKSPHSFLANKHQLCLELVKPLSFSQTDLSITRIVCMCFIFGRAIFFHFRSVVACVQTPAPQEKSEKGSLLQFFLRGGGVCPQAILQSLSLFLKAERRIGVISEAEVRSFPNFFLHQLTKYSSLFLIQCSTRGGGGGNRVATIGEKHC